MQAGFFNIPVLGTGTFGQREIHAHAEAPHAENAGGIVVQRLGVGGMDFTALKVGQSVGGIKQQGTGCLIEREGDCVDGEVPALQIFVNGGRDYGRLRTRAAIFFHLSHGEFSGDVAGEEHFNAFLAIIGGDDFSVHRFLQKLHDRFGRAFDHEIEITNGVAAQNIAHGAAG